MSVEQRTSTGYYSLVRWRNDVVRDEAKNLAVLLVVPDSGFADLKSAPPSAMSKSLRQQGIVDSMLVAIEEEMTARAEGMIETLEDLHGAYRRSVYVTEPRSTAIPSSEEDALDSLYDALVKPPGRPRSPLSKSTILDRVMRDLRKTGIKARRGTYIDDFFFDVVSDTAETSWRVANVFSFATGRKRWVPIEQEAAHFVFGCGRLEVRGLAAVQEPTDSSSRDAVASYDRIRSWFESEDIDVTAPDQVVEPTLL